MTLQEPSIAHLAEEIGGKLKELLTFFVTISHQGPVMDLNVCTTSQSNRITQSQQNNAQPGDIAISGLYISHMCILYTIADHIFSLQILAFELVLHVWKF